MHSSHVHLECLVDPGKSLGGPVTQRLALVTNAVKAGCLGFRSVLFPGRLKRNGLIGARAGVLAQVRKRISLTKQGRRKGRQDIYLA